MEMFGALIRQQFKDEDVYSVAIMPCTAKKFEAQRPELVKDGKRLVDLVLTTDELGKLIKAAGIDFKNLPDSEPDDPLGDYTGAGVIFGVTGGVTEAVIRHVLNSAAPDTLQTIAECGVRGLEGIKAFSVTAGDLTLKPNGCIGGGGQPPASNARKRERMEAIFKADEACELKIPSQNPAMKYVYDELMKGRAHELLHIHYPLHGHH